MSVTIEWSKEDKSIMRAAHAAANGAPVWLLPPAAPALEFPHNGLPGGEQTNYPKRTPGARLLVIAGDLSFALEVELETLYPTGAPAGGLALPAAALKSDDKYAGRPWPPAPDYLFDGSAQPWDVERLEIGGTDLSDAADVLTHAAVDDYQIDAMHGVQVRRGVGAGATDGHRSTIPTAVARGQASMAGSLFLPSGLVALLRTIEARDATVERWRDGGGAGTGPLRCLATGLRWRAAWVTPSGAEPESNHATITTRLISGPVFASATILPDALPDRSAWSKLRKALADIGKWTANRSLAKAWDEIAERDGLRGGFSLPAELRLSSARVEVWGPTSCPEIVEVDGKTEIRVPARELLGAIGHPDPLPPWTLLDGPAWIRVDPRYLLDALEIATPLREVRLLGSDQVEVCQSPIVLFGERQTSVVMPLVPDELQAMRTELKARGAAA